MEIKLLQIKESKGESVASAASVARFMRAEANADRECVWVLHLNVKNVIIEKELVSMGVLNSSLVAPREIFKGAILNSANSIIVVHNHPSCLPEPSEEDIRIMKVLEESGKILGIPLLDFVIISPSGKYWSVNETGE